MTFIRDLNKTKSNYSVCIAATSKRRTFKVPATLVKAMMYKKNAWKE